ncbi:MAG: transcriptional regulator [Anaerolineales bacterium]
MKEDHPLNPQEISALDRVVHSPTRLKILLVLLTVEEADFTFIARAADLTRGNLSANLSKLEEVGYVKIEKKFIERVPKTIVNITAKGVKALENYSNLLGPILDELRK